MFDYQEV